VEALEPPVRTSIPYFGLSMHHDSFHQHKEAALCYPVFSPLREISKSGFSVRRACLSAWNNSAPSGRIFMKFDISVSNKIVENIEILFKSDKNNTYLT